jgi:hypothetical protein
VIGAARDLDRDAIRRGVVVGAAVVGPLAAASSVLARSDGEGAGPLSLLFFAGILVGFGVAGAATARTDVPLPYTHGAMTGLATYALVQLAVLVVSTIVGRDGGVSVAALVFNGLLAASAGMIGAMLGARRRRAN